MLFDPVRKVIGMAHAGWQGTVKQIAAKTVCAMKENYGSDPKDMYAAIGPSIGPDHYEVGVDVVKKTEESFKDDTRKLLINENGSIHLNLWEANKLALEYIGVKNIYCAEICTACNTIDWFSHRGEKEKNGKTGRFCAVLAML
jgi:YfiH family protein